MGPRAARAAPPWWVVLLLALAGCGGEEGRGAATAPAAATGVAPATVRVTAAGKEPRVAPPSEPATAAPLAAPVRVVSSAGGAVTVTRVRHWSTAFGLSGTSLSLRWERAAEAAPAPDYVETPRVVATVRFGSGGSVAADAVIGYPGGFDRDAELNLHGEFGSETVISSLEFDLPVARMIEADTARYVLARAGDSAELPRAWVAGVAASENAVWVGRSSRDGGLPNAFFRAPGRWDTDFFRIRDGAGRLAGYRGGSLGGGEHSEQYGIDEPHDAPLVFPVTVQTVVPRRWETTVHRFVLTAVPIPARGE